MRSARCTAEAVGLAVAGAVMYGVGGWAVASEGAYGIGIVGYLFGTFAWLAAGGTIGYVVSLPSPPLRLDVFVAALVVGCINLASAALIDVWQFRATFLAVAAVVFGGASWVGLEPEDAGIDA